MCVPVCMCIGMEDKDAHTHTHITVVYAVFAYTVIFEDKDGLLNVTGGKWTTYRCVCVWRRGGGENAVPSLIGRV